MPAHDTGRSMKSATAGRFCVLNQYSYTCDLPYFRGDQVEALVWAWLKGLLTDPSAVAKGLGAMQEEREKEQAPIRERLKVVDDLLAVNQRQLDRLLDLYLSGDFPKNVLDERR